MKQLFQLREQYRHYEGTLFGFHVIIPIEAFHDETIAAASQISESYTQKAEEIAHFCMSNDYFTAAYGAMSVQQIIEKLQKPIIYVYEHSGTLTYVEHLFDADHIIDIEFEGILEHFNEVIIDG